MRRARRLKRPVRRRTNNKIKLHYIKHKNFVFINFPYNSNGIIVDDEKILIRTTLYDKNFQPLEDKTLTLNIKSNFNNYTETISTNSQGIAKYYFSPPTAAQDNEYYNITAIYNDTSTTQNLKVLKHL